MNGSSASQLAATLRLLPLLSAVLLLCSCRSGPPYLSALKPDSASSLADRDSHAAPLPSPAPSPAPGVPHAHPQFAQVAYHQPMLPPQAASGAIAVPCPHCGPAQSASNARVVPGYSPAYGNWQPPGIPGAWPRDEYIFDGGDKPLEARVDGDWTVRGLDVEDTIAHYDTLDGRVVVQPSNRVSIYAPRFAAVRKVDGLQLHHQQEQSLGAVLTTSLARADDLQIPTTAIQPVQSVSQNGTKTLSTFRERLYGIEIGDSRVLAAFENTFQLFEDLQIIHNGTYKASEKARLADGVEAAVAWTGNQAVQIFVDSDQAVVVDGSRRPQEVDGGQRQTGQPRLSFVKVASTRHARPGETIDFTLRFDNVGDETVGNVTIVDNLTPRLEYVEGSAQSTLKADFFTDSNERESLVLRWEIIDPLPAGQGGVLRFRCRVR